LNAEKGEKVTRSVMNNLPWNTSWSFATSWTSASSNRLWRRSTLKGS